MNITHDPNQMLKTYNLSNITDDICLDSDPKVKDFLLENKHLINYIKLAKNMSKWSFNFCYEYLINNENIENDLLEGIYYNLMMYNDENFFNNKDLLDKLLYYIKNGNFDSSFCDYIYKFFQFNEYYYSILLNEIIKIDNNFTNNEFYFSHINYILQYCDLKTYLLLCDKNKLLKDNFFSLVNPNKLIEDELKFGDSDLNKYNKISLNENDEVVDYIIKNFINKKIYLHILFLNLNKNNKVVEFLINNKIYIRKQFTKNLNPIAIEYCKNNIIK